MQVLIDELKKPEYQGKTDRQAADMVNAKTVSVRSLVDLWGIEEYARRNGIRVALERAKFDVTHPCQSIAIDILAYITSPRTQKLDVDLEETRDMFGAMVQCGFATEQQVGEMIALADESVLWIDHNKVGRVTADIVKELREEISGVRDTRQQVISEESSKWNQWYSDIHEWDGTGPAPRLCNYGG